MNLQFRGPFVDLHEGKSWVPERDPVEAFGSSKAFQNISHKAPHQKSDAGVGIGTLVGDRLRWGLPPPHPLKVGLWASLLAINGP